MPLASLLHVCWPLLMASLLLSAQGSALTVLELALAADQTYPPPPFTFFAVVLADCLPLLSEAGPCRQPAFNLPGLLPVLTLAHPVVFCLYCGESLFIVHCYN